MIYLDGQHFDHREPLPKEEETIDRLKKLVNSDDPEIAHSEADDILCEFLKQQGCQELVEVYEQIPKFYA